MTDSQRWLVLAGTLVLGWLVYLLAPILTPFLAGALLAYLGDPLVDRLEARKIQRSAAVGIVFVAIILLSTLCLLLLLPMVELQIEVLRNRLPVYIDALQTRIIPRLSDWAGLDPAAFDLAAVREVLREQWQSAGSLAASLLGSLSQSGLALLAWIANVVMVPVVTFYMLRDWDLIMARIRELLPRSSEPVIVRLAQESDQVLGAFLRGQLSVMAALATVYSIGLWLAGVDLALLIGLLAGLLSFVPYLGVFIGFGSAALAVLLQTQDFFALLPVAAVFVVGQVLEGFVLTPWLVGDRIGLHPVSVIFAVLAGGQLFGFVGVLLALPIAAVLAVLVRHANDHYRASGWYRAGEAGGNGDVPGD